MKFLKSWFAGIMIILGCIVPGLITGCNQRQQVEIDPLQMAVAPSTNNPTGVLGVYDDKLNTVYLKVSQKVVNAEDAAVAELIVKKRQWQEQNPASRIVTMSIVSGDTEQSSYGHTAVVGLLIHYEQK